MKAFFLFITFTIVYAGTFQAQVKPMTVAVLYQPSIVDVLDPSRMRIA